MDWLSPLNFWQRQVDVHSRREEGTAQSIFEEPAFKKWLDGSERILWCPGMRKRGQIKPFTSADALVIAGAGKTILAYDFVKEKTFTS